MTGTGGILEVLANEGANPLFSRPNFNDLYVTSRIQIHYGDFPYYWVTQNYGFVYQSIFGLFIQE